jgi:mannose-1-phosphate guanylyltransferase
MTSKGNNLWGVIMAGGGGTRLWPASRQGTPKQFLRLHGASTLLEQTCERLKGLIPPERLLVVTSMEHVDEARRLLPEVPPENILGEPAARNTLPCVAWACAEIARRDPNSTQVVLPADHLIEPAEAFRDTLRAAAAFAETQSGSLVTLGIRPSHPATGFGYLQAGDSVGDSLGQEVFPVERFVEKPGLQKAVEFLASGQYFWNGGMFIWTTQSLISVLEKHAPAMWKALNSASAEGTCAVYPTLESVSVDVGLMEKADGIFMLPIGYMWSDIGSWSALEEVIAADESGNHASGSGRLISEDATGNITFTSEGQTVALIGVENLVVVSTPDATLVCPKNRAQDVRAMVERLKKQAPELL